MGGAERVAANISAYAPEGEFEFHYLVFEGHEDVYGSEITARGGKVITVPPPSKGYAAYIRRLTKLIRENRYAAVHSHTMFNSGINLAIAKLMRVPVRIAHSHTTRTERTVSRTQRLYERIMQTIINRTATDLLACGVEAGEWLFGQKAFSMRGRVVRNGIDTDAFSFSEQNRERLREMLGITQKDLVIGHSGTLIPLKNQEYLIRLLPRIKESVPNTYLLLLGKGEGIELDRLKAVASECGVTDSVLFCGGVMNANEYLSAMDVFAFPSLREGTPLALIEAQANGLPCIISDRIPDDATLTDLVHSVSLENELGWLDALVSNRRMNPEHYSQKIVDAGYSTKTAYLPIYEIYRKKGKNVKQAAVSFSFDDARGDNKDVFCSILDRLGFPATLNVTTGYVDGSCPEKLRPSTKPAMTKDDVIALWKNPRFEIAMHGDRHLNTVQDISESRKKLICWLNLPRETSLGFASPGSGLTIGEFLSPEYHEIRFGLLYLRTSFRIRSKKTIRTLFRKAGRIVHVPLFYRIAYSDTIMHFRDGKVIYSIPVMKDATLGQVKSIIKLCIKTGGNLTLMFHSILRDTKGEDNWTWSWKKYEKLCIWLKKKTEEGAVSICTTAQLFDRMNH